MQQALVPTLRCPKCRADSSLHVIIDEENGREIRQGRLVCRECGLAAQIECGVPQLLYGAPDHVHREAEGLARFAEVMKNDGWTKDRVLGLPFGIESGYWFVQAVSIDQLARTVPLQAGQTLLDVGSNTCWASNFFAERGLNVIALDIALLAPQGLYTAEWYFERKPELFFERVLGSMFNIPIASSQLDYVYCCEVLHHSSPDELPATFAELHRVLKPGGQLLVINEPLKFPFNLKRDHGSEVAQFEGNENVYFFHQYLMAARRAGFAVKTLEPAYHALFRQDDAGLAPVARWIRDRAMPSVPLRRTMKNLLFTFGGGPVALNMLCRKRG